MTLGILGAAFLVVLAWMCWGDRRGIGIAVVAVLLGVIIAGSNGVLGTFAHTTLGAVSTAGTAIAQMIDSGGKR